MGIKKLILNRNLFLSLLNELPLLKSSGIKLCAQKSRLIRIFGIWLLPYKSLGLKLYTSLGKLKQIFYLIMNRPIPLELSSWTRGRGANPTKGKLGIPGSRTKLEFLDTLKTKSLNLTSMLKRYKKYFGLIISILYTSSPSSLLLCSHKPLNQKSTREPFFETSFAD